LWRCANNITPPSGVPWRNTWAAASGPASPAAAKPPTA